MNKRLLLSSILFVLIVVNILVLVYRPEFTGFAVSTLTASQTGSYIDGFIDDTNVIYSTQTYLQIGFDSSFGNIYRSFIDFDTSSIPSNAVINGVNLSLTVNTAGSVSVIVYSINQTAYSLSGDGASLNSLCGGGAGATIANSSTSFTGIGAGTNVNIVLNSDANSNLQSQLSQGFFSVCIKATNEAGNLLKVNSSESTGGKPMLYVSYSLPADTTPPLVNITSPSNTAYNQYNFPLSFNVSLNELGNVTFSLDEWATNYTMTSINGTYYNYTMPSLSDGNYSFIVWANDTLNNVNATTNVSFSVDVTNPRVTIISPTATIYSGGDYSVNVRLNESGSCLYSLSNGASNTSLTANSSNTGFTGSVSGAGNGNYVLWAYCTDSAGNRNYTTNVSFSISIPTTSSGGGGGGGGTIVQPIVNESCQNECNPGNYCSGNFVVSCSLVGECYKETSRIECSSDKICLSGICVIAQNDTESNSSNEIYPIQEDRNSDKDNGEKKSSGSYIPNLPKPSDFLSIPGVPPVIVDSAAGATAVGATAGIAWWIWILIAGSSLPFFLIKLRHYSVSVFDSGNRLNILKNGKLDKKKAYEFLRKVEMNFGEFVFASGHEEVLQYLVPGGFVEVRVDQPFIITGHFTKSGDSERFALALKKACSAFGANVPLFRVVERASVFGALRAWRRKRRSEAQLRKITG